RLVGEYRAAVDADAAVNLGLRDSRCDPGEQGEAQQGEAQREDRAWHRSSIAAARIRKAAAVPTGWRAPGSAYRNAAPVRRHRAGAGTVVPPPRRRARAPSRRRR